MKTRRRYRMIVLSNPTKKVLTRVHPEALKALQMYKDDLKAGHTGAAEYWRGQAGAYFTANPRQLHLPLFRRVQEGSTDWNKEIPWAYNQGFMDARNGYPNQKAQYDFEAAYDQGYRHGKNGMQNPILATIGSGVLAGIGLGVGFSAVNWGKGKLMKKKNPEGGHLGIRIAVNAHKEGRAAYKDGKSQRDNPYDAKAVQDSDEWLRYQNWRNGWVYAWFTDPDKEGSRKRY